MKQLRILAGPYLILAMLGILASVAALRGDSSTLGGWVAYYDAEWNEVGEWYHPCSGSTTHWGVGGVNSEILDWWNCEGGGGGECNGIPTISPYCGDGCTNTSETSLICSE
jgi:hypothetical protein